MPELPEAETLRLQLEPLIVGQRIQRSWARLPRRTFPDIDQFIRLSSNTRLIAAKRRGKQIYFPLENGWSFLVHLGMSGRLHLESDPGGAGSMSFPPDRKHVHAALLFENGSQLLFTDPRTFGAVGVSRDLPFLQELGPEPLDANFDEAALVAQLKKRTAKIKSVLLDQKTVAGLGNIYADELCFLARVHPATPANQVPRQKLRFLVSQMKPVLERAIAARGATLKDGGYQDLFGTSGEYFPLAYGRTGEPCQECSTSIERGKLGLGKSARSFHFCPNCQKEVK